MDVMATRSGIEAALARNSGTVTAFLEQLVGELIDADERCHTITHAGELNPLQVPLGHPLLKRTVVLRGRSSARSYVYAESLLVQERLPAVFLSRLETSAHPIGRILTEEDIAFTRVPLTPPDACPAFVAGDVPSTTNDWAFARKYRIDVSGTPAMLIVEWFLSSLQSFSPPAIAHTASVENR